MNKHQVNWARSHDWFAGTGSNNGIITIYVCDDMDSNNELGFTDFEELLAWAGY